MNSFEPIEIQSKNGASYLLVMAGRGNSGFGEKLTLQHNATKAERFFKEIKADTPTWRAILQKITNDPTSRTLSAQQAMQEIKDLFAQGRFEIYRTTSAFTNTQAGGATAIDDPFHPTSRRSGGAVVRNTKTSDPGEENMAAHGPGNSRVHLNDSGANTNTDADASKNDNDDSDKNCDQEGEPISMVSGEELLTLADFSLPGPIPFTWSRTYRTSHSRNQGIGHGWSHTGLEYLLLTEDGIEYYAGDSHKVVFARPPLGYKSRHLHEDMTLIFKEHDTIVIEQSAQPTKVFRHIGQRRFRLQQWRHKAYTAANHNGTQEKGFVLNFAYDNFGHLQAIKGNWGQGLHIFRDEFARIVAVHQTTPQGDILQPALMTYDYDLKGDLTRTRNADGHGESYAYKNHIIVQRTLATGYNFYFEWDRYDNQARCQRQWGGGGHYDYHFKWDPDNNRSEATDSRGYTKKFVYDEFGHTIQLTDAQGHVHHRQYNDAGKLVAEIDPLGHRSEYLYDEQQHLLRVTDALGQQRHWHYRKGQIKHSVDEAGNKWQREYDAHGLLSAVIGPRGEQTDYHYNEQGLIARITDAAGRTTDYEWNERAELIKQTDPLGNALHFRYDAWGRIEQIFGQQKQQSLAEASQNPTRYEYTAGGRLAKIISGEEITQFRYHANGRLSHYTDAQGRITEYQYADGLSQPTARIDAADNTIRYEYDSERNLTKLINEKGESYQFFYDGNERLIKEIGFDGRVQEYQYNAAGQLQSHTDAGQVQTRFTRDALGRLLEKNTQLINSGELQQHEQVKYRYDALGRLIEAANAEQYLGFDYDATGNITAETQINLTSRNKQKIRHQYNILGQRLQTRLPDGQVINYNYDDSLGLNSVNVDQRPIVNIERDILGREIKRTQGQVETHSDYDPQGRLQQHRTLHKESQQAIIQRRYDYDQYGNLNLLQDGSEETRYLYDILNRVKHGDGEQQEFFDFDPAGNILSITETALPAPGLVKGNRLLVQGDKKFLYDERGNLIKQIRGKEARLFTAYSYNLQNELIKVETQDASQTVRYAYDPLGRRISKTDSFGTTTFLWHDNLLAQEQRNNIKKTYVFEPGTYRPLAFIQDGEIYHYHLDHLGTPRELSNQQGEIVWKARYKTYGALALKEIDEIENNIRFQGQYYDEESGLHYNRFRYYNPDSGQFISQDPIGLAGGVNNYQYADNPLMWIDPLGLCKDSEYDQQQKALAASNGTMTTVAAFKAEDWLPERQELHHDLLGEKLAQVAQLQDAYLDTPTIFAMRGNSGSGKSRFVNSGKVPGVDSMDALPVINPDHFKALLIEASPTPLTHQQVHAESSHLANQFQQALIVTEADGTPISMMVDKRLGKTSDVVKLKKTAEASGRQLKVYDIDAPLEMSLIGILQRKPGGSDPIVPFEVVGEGGFQPARQNRKAIMQIFEDNPELGTYELYGTTPAGEKKLVAKIEKGKRQTFDQDEVEKLTKNPDQELNDIKNRVIDDQEIARLTNPLPEGEWKNDVVKTLNNNKGKTWNDAITDHGAIGA